MGKQSAAAFKQHEVESMARQQNRMNNPNQHNYFGSTTTEFGPDDQATITQTMSPELQGLLDTQLDFARQGPAQLGDFSNPFIEGLLGGAASGIARRSGFQAPPLDMGGFNSTLPQANLNMSGPTSDQSLGMGVGMGPAPTPHAPTSDSSLGMGVGVNAHPMMDTSHEAAPSKAQQMAKALGTGASMAAASPYQGMINGMMTGPQQQSQNPLMGLHQLIQKGS